MLDLLCLGIGIESLFDDILIKFDNLLEIAASEKNIFIENGVLIINGTGIYSVEEQTRDQRRMDVVIHYLGKRYVIELKIWRGERYNEEGEKQLKGYLDYFGLDTGYLISLNFNKKK